MAATVQAACPGCRNILRIPVDWTDRPLRCKKCGTMVQARKKAAAGPAPDTATAPAVGHTAPVPAYPPAAAAGPTPPPPGAYPTPPAGYPALPAGYPSAATPGYPPYAVPGYGYPPAAPPDPFEQAVNESPEPGPARRPYRPRRTGGKVLGIAVVLFLCGALAGGGAVLYTKYISPQLPKVPHRRADTAGVVEGGGKSALAGAGERFPRRLLFVHVANYVYFNNLSAGMSEGKDMPTKSAAKMAFELRVPTEKDNNQLFVLSDTAGGKDFRPPVKPVIEGAYARFFETSREQDRVVVYFGGHAVVADGKAYLVPAEGEPDNPATFIPLDDFYAKLKACKAQQKVVLFDVCRLDPDRGEEKPGAERMSAELAKLLLAAPPGVQVALSCAPGQNAQENHETGSEFLTAFRVVAERTKRSGKAVPARPEDPIPAAQWLDGIRAFLAEPRGKTPPQAVKSAGEEPPTRVAFNKDEPAARRFDWPTAPQGVPADTVVQILQQVNLPGIRADLSVPADLPRVYPFAEGVMKDYKPDGVSEQQIRKDGAKYPIRKAALEALDKIREVWRMGGGEGKVGIMDEFEGEADEKLKKAIVEQQMVPAKIILGLDEVIADLDAAAKSLDAEKSKRWRAVFEYARAQALLRWTFMQEYDAALGKIRTDNLPKDPNGMRTGLRLVSTPKTSPKHKEKLEAARELLDKMAEEHKGTPYEVLAKLHRHISVGLEWRAVSKDGKKDEDAK